MKTVDQVSNTVRCPLYVLSLDWKRGLMAVCHTVISPWWSPHLREQRGDKAPEPGASSWPWIRVSYFPFVLPSWHNFERMGAPEGAVAMAEGDSATVPQMSYAEFRRWKQQKVCAGLFMFLRFISSRVWCLELQVVEWLCNYRAVAALQWWL